MLKLTVITYYSTYTIIITLSRNKKVFKTEF